MLKTILRIFLVFILVITGMLVTYFVPDRDVVRVIGTDVLRLEAGEGSPIWDPTRTNPDAGNTIDTRFIYTERKNGKPRVYRNVDAVLYLKWDSGNLAGDAQARSKQENAWAIVHHYGWRVPIFSWYPNAFKIRPADGPDHRLFPWFKIVFYAILLFILLWIWQLLRGFKRTRIDPITEKISETGEKLESDAKQTGGAISRFFRKIFGTTKG